MTYPYSNKRVLIFLITLFICCSAHAQLLDALPRHAYWGCGLAGPSVKRAGAEVSSVVPKAFAESIDLRKGDIILSVNGILISNNLLFQEIFFTTKYIKGGTPVVLEVIRDKKLIQKKGTVPPRPLESFKGIITEYKSVLTPYGYQVQVIVTRPEGTKGKIPGVFFTRWMSCDPIEKPVSRKHGVARLLEDFVQRSGYAVMRVEKPGLGDSEGPCCYNSDFLQELAAHQAAYTAFTELDFIDTTKIIILGQSNGAAWAPMAASGKMPAAYVVSGGWVKTWFEHMLEYKRKDFEWSGLPEVDINRKMTLVAEFYTDYLIHKKIPGNIIQQKPHLKEVWNDEDHHQWDLPIAYLQQLQELDVAEAWKKVNVPAFVFYGEYDIAMSAADHEKIASYVKANGAEAHYEYIPKMDHSLFWFESREKSMTDFYGSGTYTPALADTIFQWLQQILNKN